MEHGKTKIKLCGMMRPEDIESANLLRPDLVGFVFAKKSRRYVTEEAAAEMRALLSRDILAAGVFVNEDADRVAELLGKGVIDVAQLHGDEDEAYIDSLRKKTDAPIIKAFRIREHEDIARIRVPKGVRALLDAGSGDGMAFVWEWLREVDLDYYLAGGLTPENVGEAVRNYHPYGVDVSSGIETDGRKDKNKMAAFAEAVRKENGQ